MIYLDAYFFHSLLRSWCAWLYKMLLKYLFCVDYFFSFTLVKQIYAQLVTKLIVF